MQTLIAVIFSSRLQLKPSVFLILLLKEIVYKISLNTGESREVSFQHQRISVLVRRFNAILLHDSSPTTNGAD